MGYTRTRWASYTATDKKRAALRAQARDLIIKGMAKATVTSVAGIYLERGVDLRATLEEKGVCVSSHAKWTAFVNRAGTLVHMVPREGDFHIRIPLYYSTRCMSDIRLQSMLWSHIEGRIK